MKKREDGSFISVEDDTVRASDVKANRAVSLERRSVEGVGEVAYLVMSAIIKTLWIELWTRAILKENVA